MNEKAKIRYYQTPPLNVPISHLKNNQPPHAKITLHTKFKKNKHSPQKKQPSKKMFHTHKFFFIHTNPHYPYVKNERSPFQWAFYFKFALNFFLVEKQIP
jgi:hypothetical protein